MPTTARRKTAEEATKDGSAKFSEADPIEQIDQIREELETDPQPSKDSGPRRRRKSAPRDKRTPKTPGSGRKKDLTKDLTGAFGSIAIPMFALSQRNPKLAYDAQVILENAEDMAVALNDLAQRNPAIYRALFYFTNASDFSAALTIGMNMAIPIMVNHEVLPPAVLGAVTVSKPPPHVAEKMQNAQRQEPFRPTVMGRVHNGDEDT